MFYFESLKINTDTFNSPYSLTLKLDDQNLHFVTSNNIEWLNKLFLFTKDRSFYHQGNWLVDNYDLIHMNKSMFSKFANQNFTFCDDTLIINSKWSVNKLIRFYKSFYKLKNNKIDELLQILELKEINLNTKIKDLKVFELIKIKLLLSNLKANKYVIINLINYSNLDSTSCEKLVELLEKLKTKYQSEYLIFINNRLDIKNKIVLDSKDYLFFNKTLTIGNTIFTKNIKHNNTWTIIWNLIKILRFDLLLVFVINLIIFTICIWMIVLDSYSGSSSTITNDFIRNNSAIWKTITYLLYIFSYITIFIGWAVMRRKRKKYLAFLASNNYNRMLIAYIWPVVFGVTTLLSIIVAFLFTIAIATKSTSLELNELKYQLAIFLYILYMTIFAVALSLQVNQTIKPDGLKQTFIKIITS